MSNEEQHQMLCEIMAKLVTVLSCDELSLLSHHCGLSIEDWYYPHIKQDLEVNRGRN